MVKVLAFGAKGLGLKSRSLSPSIPENGYLLLPNHDMTERFLKRLKLFKTTQPNPMHIFRPSSDNELLEYRRQFFSEKNSKYPKSNMFWTALVPIMMRDNCISLIFQASKCDTCSYIF